MFQVSLPFRGGRLIGSQLEPANNSFCEYCRFQWHNKELKSQQKQAGSSLVHSAFLVAFEKYPALNAHVHQQVAKIVVWWGLSGRFSLPTLQTMMLLIPLYRDLHTKHNLTSVTNICLLTQKIIFSLTQPTDWVN